MEERYKKYLEKAKSVSVSLRVSQLSHCGSLTSRDSHDTRLNHDLSDHEEMDRNGAHPWATSSLSRGKHLSMCERRGSPYLA